MTSSRSRWLLRRPSEQAEFRLFCLPYSGVGASMYNRWPAQAGRVDLIPVQLPGRENRLREKHFGTYEAMAESLAEEFAPYLDRPFGYFGHCGGALAAFAATWELDRIGGPAPACLFVSSQVAPHDGPSGRFLTMPEQELRAELARLTIAMGGEPRSDAMDLGMETLRPDIAANRAYHWDAPQALRCDLYAIAWQADDEVARERMDGWAVYAPPGRYHPVVLEGGHHAFLRAPMALLDTFRRGFARSARHRPASTAAPEAMR